MTVPSTPSPPTPPTGHTCSTRNLSSFLDTFSSLSPLRCHIPCLWLVLCVCVRTCVGVCMFLCISLLLTADSHSSFLHLPLLNSSPCPHPDHSLFDFSFRYEFTHVPERGCEMIISPRMFATVVKSYSRHRKVRMYLGSPNFANETCSCWSVLDPCWLVC